MMNRLRISHVIHHVFDVLTNEVGGRFGAVATSKLLHIALPDLFVMWDNAISDGYDVKMTGYSYAYKFMPRMKDELEEAIDDFIKHHPCSRDEAIGRIRKEANNEPNTETNRRIQLAPLHKTANITPFFPKTTKLLTFK